MKSKVINLLKGKTFVRGGIGSRTICKSGAFKTILFYFDAGQQLSEHTASVAAAIHILEGRARIKLGKKTVHAVADTWIFMPPHLPHAVEAKTRMVMLLTMFLQTGHGCDEGHQKKRRLC